jgi:tRNA(fMet)-specific endonuclease VapC
MNGRPAEVRSVFSKVHPGEVGVSSITLSELWYGMENSSHREKNVSLLRMFISPLIIADFNENAAIEYGKIRSYLKKHGSMIGDMDLLIAAHAKALSITLITNNLREFRRVPGLKLENWVE